MKVLGIVGSPRKQGNTEILVAEALATCREEGAETELVLLAGKEIKGCDGCSTCRKTGLCHVKDDMQPLFKQMEAADAILFGSPVYFHGVTAQLKAVMDRTFYFLPKHNLKGKVAASVLALRRVGAGQTRSHLYGYFHSLGMVPVRGAIGYGRERGDVKDGFGGGINATALEEAHATGQEVMELLKRLS